MSSALRAGLSYRSIISNNASSVASGTVRNLSSKSVFQIFKESKMQNLADDINESVPQRDNQSERQTRRNGNTLRNGKIRRQQQEDMYILRAHEIDEEFNEQANSILRDNNGQSFPHKGSPLRELMDAQKELNGGRNFFDVRDMRTGLVKSMRKKGGYRTGTAGATFESVHDDGTLTGQSLYPLPPLPRPTQYTTKEIDKKKVLNSLSSSAASSGAGSTESISALEEIKTFSKKPRDVKAHLDRFVISQEDAKRVLSVALTDHYNRIRRNLNGEETGNFVKPNILLLGPTGSGKSHSVRALADLISVPFVKADATTFSATGYVGADATECVKRLVTAANGDVELAEFGIVMIDEIDKIACVPGSMSNINSRDVQTSLLKIMEDCDVELDKKPQQEQEPPTPQRQPRSFIEQQQMLQAQKEKKPEKRTTISTKNILFILCGAFNTLDNTTKGDSTPSTEDFVKAGFEPELIGRIPIRIALDKLKEKDLVDILTKTENSVVKQATNDLKSYDIDLEFTQGALEEVAKQAYKQGVGARGLNTIIEMVLRDYKFELPSTDIKKVVIDEFCVQNPKMSLETLLSQNTKASLETLLSQNPQ
jgi:ATP-dependent Clp protease ATP-binding subunit ClpX